MFGPDISHVPCDLAQQERRRSARRQALARRLARSTRGRRRDDQGVSADEVEAAVRGSPDVWASLRF